jgi:hypothetical protein
MEDCTTANKTHPSKPRFVWDGEGEGREDLSLRSNHDTKFPSAINVDSSCRSPWPPTEAYSPKRMTQYERRQVYQKCRMPCGQFEALTPSILSLAASTASPGQTAGFGDETPPAHPGWKGTSMQDKEGKERSKYSEGSASFRKRGGR